MGLGSKLPCASIEACFSSVAPGLASTKSGGRAPAMAHRHDLAILNSSASYFYTRDKTQQREGYCFFASSRTCLFGLLDGQTEQSKAEEREGKGGKMKDRELEWPAPSDGLSQTDKWFICFGFASAALLTSTSLSFHFTTSDYWELFSQEGHTQVLKTWDFQKTDYKKQQQTEQISMRVKAAGLLNVLLYNTEGYKENIALYSWHF